jgi:hypothetical protein
VIDFIGEIKDEYGTTIQNIRDKVDIKLSGSTAAELATRPIEYDTGFTLLPGKYKIKFLARDAETGPHRNIPAQLRRSESQQGREAHSHQLRGSFEPARRNEGRHLQRQGQGSAARLQPAGAGRPKAHPQRDARIPQESRHVRVLAGLPTRCDYHASRWSRS